MKRFVNSESAAVIAIMSIAVMAMTILQPVLPLYLTSIGVVPSVMGLMSGIQTQPACLAYANEHGGSDAPNVWYASVYPVSMIAKIILAQLLVGWLLWGQRPAGVTNRVSTLVSNASQSPVTAPAGQLQPVADPAFWGAWFRGHVGNEALQRAKALQDAYGHHRAVMMIVEAIGTDLYGPGAHW
jgi:hypothetical protein